MDKLKLMKTFKLIVEEGSIVRAASILGITKAAASKQLMTIEQLLNTQLLHRTTRSIKLTDIGQLYYESLKKVFSAVGESESVISQIHEKPTGVLKVTSHRHFGEKYILSRMQQFVYLYPDLKLDIEFSDRFPDMEKENIDILCGIGNDGPDYLVRKKVASTYHTLCSSPDYVKQFGMPSIPDQLKYHRYITHSFRNPDNILLFKGGKKVFVDYCIRVNDSQAMLQCALQGLGIIKIYDYFVRDFIQNKKLIEILSDYREKQTSIYIFYQQHKFLQPKIRLFLDFLYENISLIDSDYDYHVKMKHA